jgi:hypothetical protein
MFGGSLRATGHLWGGSRSHPHGVEVARKPPTGVGGDCQDSHFIFLKNKNKKYNFSF